MRDSILDFISGYSDKKKQAPSIRTILSHFKKDKLNRELFYAIFPKGISEACRLAGIPAPHKRIGKTKKINSQKKKKRRDIENSGSVLRLCLSQDQSARVCGIMQLEGGTDPSMIIDRLLDEDTDARKMGISLETRRKVSVFLHETRRKVL